MKMHQIPHVIIFANWPPDRTRLSEDRWDLREMTSDDQTWTCLHSDTLIKQEKKDAPDEDISHPICLDSFDDDDDLLLHDIVVHTSSNPFHDSLRRDAPHAGHVQSQGRQSANPRAILTILIQDPNCAGLVNRG